MTAAERPLGARFAAGAEDLAAALARLGAEDAVSLPLLGPAARRRLAAAAARLAFREATPVIGEGERAVRQEFSVSTDIPPRGALRAFAAALERVVEAGLAHLDPAPLAGPVRFNDLIVQRYEPGALGITPHRDHLRYEGLVAIVPLSGAARFFVCADRAGHGAREVPAPAGHLVLMRAPGFAGRTDRPFHFVREITRRRLSLGLRHDVRAP